jgi:hypothetical protein
MAQLIAINFRSQAANPGIGTDPFVVTVQTNGFI